ncbi:DNA-processing protein DprA [Clostridium oryzae]|nr:DNA-processing protein DprA [Clostridium oryzae]
MREKSDIIDKLYKAWNLNRLNKLYDYLVKNDINTVTVNDIQYPDKLRNLTDYPYMLYYYGDIITANRLKSVAIVGARECTNYGIDTAAFFSRELSKNGINIVSGAARGIDAVAHKTTLQNNGFTTAVLGCGIDTVYPAENKNIYDNIKRNGCLISEFPPGTRPLSYNFPIRNRIISGLSDYILVVEAAERSGSLITASLALEMGKDVGAVPGSIFSKSSAGCNKLIRDGALTVTEIDDILPILGLPSKNINSLGGVNRIEGKSKKKIYDILSDNPMHIDDILKIVNIDITLLYELLLEMQLDDLVRCVSGDYYVKVNDI